MTKVIKRILIGCIFLLVMMQFYQPARNIDKGEILASHITKVYNVPTNVQNIFQNSCYDCHSNNTRYPWYSYIQPGRMFMDRHIKNGKKNLNFSEFGNYSRRKQENKLESIIKQVKSGEMPLPSYLLLHKDAKLTPENIVILDAWISTIKIDE